MGFQCSDKKYSKPYLILCERLQYSQHSLPLSNQDHWKNMHVVIFLQNSSASVWKLNVQQVALKG